MPHPFPTLRPVVLLAALVFAACASQAPPEARYSPATQDPPVFDLDAPPSMIERW